METRVQEQQKPKSTWEKPEIEVLDIKNTKYWGFQMGEDGFWENVWADDFESFS